VPPLVVLGEIDFEQITTVVAFEEIANLGKIKTHNGFVVVEGRRNDEPRLDIGSKKAIGPIGQDTEGSPSLPTSVTYSGPKQSVDV
jgi:hypothetical protein